MTVEIQGRGITGTLENHSPALQTSKEYLYNNLEIVKCHPNLQGKEFFVQAIHDNLLNNFKESCSSRIQSMSNLKAILGLRLYSIMIYLLQNVEVVKHAY